MDFPSPYKLCIVTGSCKSDTPSPAVPDHIRRFVRDAQVAGLRAAGISTSEPTGLDGELVITLPNIPPLPAALRTEAAADSTRRGE